MMVFCQSTKSKGFSIYTRIHGGVLSMLNLTFDCLCILYAECRLATDGEYMTTIPRLHSIAVFESKYKNERSAALNISNIEVLDQKFETFNKTIYVFEVID